MVFLKIHPDWPSLVPTKNWSAPKLDMVSSHRSFRLSLISSLHLCVQNTMSFGVYLSHTFLFPLLSHSVIAFPVPLASTWRISVCVIHGLRCYVPPEGFPERLLRFPFSTDHLKALHGILLSPVLANCMFTSFDSFSKYNKQLQISC